MSSCTLVNSSLMSEVLSAAPHSLSHDYNLIQIHMTNNNLLKYSVSFGNEKTKVENDDDDKPVLFL